MISKSDMTWKYAIFRRLLITFLFTMVPIYILGISVYEWGISTLRNEITNSMDTQVTFYLQNLENQIQGIQKFEYDLETDKDLRSLAILPQLLNYYEKDSVILSLQSKLFIMEDDNPFIKDIIVNIPAIDRSISALNGIGGINADEYKMINDLPYTSTSPVIYKNGMIFMYRNYPSLGLSAQDNAMAQIVIELSTDKLKNSLDFIKNYSDSGTLLISESGQFSISNDSNAGRSEQYNNTILKYMKENKKDINKSSVKIGSENYLSICNESNFLNMTLSAYISENQIFSKLSIYRLWFFIITIAVVIIILTYCVSTYRLIHKPIKKLAEAFFELEKGNMGSAIEHYNADEFRYIYHRFNVMVENLKILIDQVYKQKILAQNAEMKQLQSQISPHFLYNSFFIMHRMIAGEDYNNALKFSNYLGDYFRFITRSAEDDITLQSEVHHARIYAEIQAIRSSRHIKSVQFDELPEEYNELKVPRLIIQPLVENAFEHGLKDIVNGGTLIVRFCRSTDSLCIIVEDNGSCIGLPEVENMKKLLKNIDQNLEKTGIIIIHRRLQLRFGSNAGIEVALSELGGLKVIMNIPIEKGN